VVAGRPGATGGRVLAHQPDPASASPLFGVSKSADRIIDNVAPLLALKQRQRFRKDAVLNTRLVVAVGRPVPGNRNDSVAWTLSGVTERVGHVTTIADGGYRGTGLVMPHRKPTGGKLPAWKVEHNRSHNRVRARIEHAFARMKAWKILRDCRLRGDGVHHAMLGVARLHNLMLTA
jgi:hypothetical protein